MTYTIDQFIREFSVQPADAIKMKKKFFGMLDHYVIYLGVHENKHKFIANYRKGVEILPDTDIIELVGLLQPSEIERFPGTDMERRFGVERALARRGEQDYNLFSNNCEHFKNWVHYGIDKSAQVEALGASLALVGTGAALFGVAKKDGGLSFAGVLLAIIGAIILQSERNKRVPAFRYMQSFYQ